MIYVFENKNNNASVVFNGLDLTNEQKIKSIQVEKLPTHIEIEGKIPVLKCKKETNEIWYDYIKKEINEFEELKAKNQMLEMLISDIDARLGGLR